MRKYFPSLLVLSVGSILSVSGFFIVEKMEHHRMHQTFAEDARTHLFTVRSAIQDALDILPSLAALFVSFEEVSRTQFRTYTTQLLVHRPYILAVEWVPYVTHVKRNSYETKARVEHPNFQFTELTINNELLPAAPRTEYFPIYYAEPADTSQHLLGLDVASEPLRVEILKKARDSGNLQATGRIHLIEKMRAHQGIMVTYPVYQADKPTQTITQRRAHLQGFVIGIFRLQDVVHNAIAHVGHYKMDFQIIDESAPPDKRVLYIYQRNDEKPWLEKLLVPRPFRENIRKTFTIHKTFDVAGRSWTVSCTPARNYPLAGRAWTSLSTLISGLLITGLLAAYLLNIIRHNARFHREIVERRCVEKALRHTERLLKEANLTLEQQVTRRTRELANSNMLLQDAHERLTTILDSLESIVYVADMQTYEVLFANQYAQQLFGHDLIGYACWQVLQGEQKPCTFCINNKLVSVEGEPTGVHTREFQNTKNQRWFFVQDQAIYWTDERLVRLEIATDITDRKQAEEDLKRTERYSQSLVMELHAVNLQLNEFKTTLDLTLDGVFMCDARTLQFFYVNQGLIKRLAYTETMLLQMRLSDIDPHFADIVSQIEALPDRVHPAITFETLHQSNTGHLIPVEIFLQYIPEVRNREEQVLLEGVFLGEERSRFVGIVRDITERKKAEQALRESEEQVRLILNSAAEGIYGMDLEGNCIFCNVSCLHILGYEKEEDLLGKNIHTLIHHTRLNGRSYPLTECPVYLALQRGENTHLPEEFLWRADGSLFPAEIWSYCTRHEGRILGAVVTFFDITERKQAQVKLQQAKEAAEQAKLVAESASQAKSTFLANMSHELRTPLNGILGYTQILSRDKSLTTKQQDGIAVIQRSAEHLLTLINDILDISKIEVGRIELYPTDFYLEEFLQGIFGLFQMRAEQKGITFTYEPLSPLPIVVYTDEKRLRQILINLLGNAVKFTEQGSVSLKVTYQKLESNIDSQLLTEEYECGRIRFQIADSGVGIAAQDMEKIFLPFQQVGNHNYWTEGTGLGLTITKKLVDLMGGTLHVDSVPGRGSLFSVEIELLEVTSVIHSVAENMLTIIGYQFSGDPIKILVVDDRVENCSVLVNILTPLGFEVHEAYSGEEAIAKARSIYPNLILMDLVMPVMNGFEATRQLRQLPEFIEIPIIAVSASVFDYHHKASLDAGCNDFISKPLRRDELLEFLQKHLALTWIYEQEERKTISTAATSKQDFILPDTATLKTLLELATIGDVSGILVRLNELEQMDAQLIPFAQKIRQWTKSFKLDVLCEFLENLVKTP